MNIDDMLITLNTFYGVEFKHLELLREGGCNTYCLQENNKCNKYFLKVIPPAFLDTAQQSLDILMYLQEHDFPSPRLILTKQGRPFIEFKETNHQCLWVLFEYIEGREPNENEDLEEIGALIGKLHCIMRNYKPQLSIHKKDFFINRYLKLLDKLKYDEGKIESFREYGDYLWSKVEQLPRGFCHGDLHRGNLLKSSEDNYYLLDFDTSCYAFPIYDIVVLCNSTNYFHFDPDGYHKSKRTYESFLKGYTKYCTLNELELNAFYDLIAIYHYQLQATIIEIYGLDCVDEAFLDQQLDWLMRWKEQCEQEGQS